MMLHLHPTISYELAKARHEERIRAAHIDRLIKQGRKQRGWPQLKLSHFLARLATPRNAINPAGRNTRKMREVQNG